MNRLIKIFSCGVIMGFYCAIVNADSSFLDSLKNYFSNNSNNVFYNNDNNKNVISSIDWSKIFKSVSPSVVSIFTQTGMNTPFNFGIGGFNFNNNQNNQEPISAGSGFCVRMQNNKLYVATNYHVIKDARQIAVLFGNDRINNSNIVNAIVYRTDPNNDLAVLEIDLNDLERNTNIQRNQIQFIKWGNSNNSEVGNQVLAIGNTFGIGLSISNGIISSKRSNMSNANNNIVENCIQHTAIINYGNSGGILVNTDGEVIGINTAMYSNNNCNNNFVIGLAIPSNIARSIIDSLIDNNNNNNNSVSRGWIGIEIQALSYDEAKNLGVLPNDPSIKPKSFGASITQVEYNGPADKAGIKPNDVVVAFNNKLIDENNPLQKLIGEYEIGKTATLFVLRRNGQNNKIEQFEFNVTVSNNNNYNYNNTNVININNREEIDDLGIVVENNNNQVVIVRGSGTMLNNWWNNWRPIQLFQEGDIITQANGTDINNTKQLKDFVRDFYNRNPNDTITFSVTRQNGFNNKSFIRVTTARIRK